MRTFPRIANLLAANWKDPTAFHNYMRSLLIDRRSGRQGFSSEIKQELVRLRAAYRLRDSVRLADGKQETLPDSLSATPESAALQVGTN
jgi:hypothetical protein